MQNIKDICELIYSLIRNEVYQWKNDRQKLLDLIQILHDYSPTKLLFLGLTIPLYAVNLSVRQHQLYCWLGCSWMSKWYETRVFPFELLETIIIIYYTKYSVLKGFRVLIIPIISHAKLLNVIDLQSIINKETQRLSKLCKAYLLLYSFVLHLCELSINELLNYVQTVKLLYLLTDQLTSQGGNAIYMHG